MAGCHETRAPERKNTPRLRHGARVLICRWRGRVTENLMAIQEHRGDTGAQREQRALKH